MEQKAELETRYNRKAWLITAMEVLSRKGQAMLRTERLARALGVTRGSFYHHFKSRDAFISALAEHWANAFTEEVNAHIAGIDAPAPVRLLKLMHLIQEKRLDKYDIAFRSWAAQEPSVAEKVRSVDASRYAFVAELFREMGFDGEDLEERVRVFLVYESAQYTVAFPAHSRQISDSVERRFKIVTDLEPPTL